MEHAQFAELWYHSPELILGSGDQIRFGRAARARFKSEKSYIITDSDTESYFFRGKNKKINRNRLVVQFLNNNILKRDHQLKLFLPSPPSLRRGPGLHNSNRWKRLQFAISSVQHL